MFFILGKIEQCWSLNPRSFVILYFQLTSSYISQTSKLYLPYLPKLVTFSFWWENPSVSFGAHNLDIIFTCFSLFFISSSLWSSYCLSLSILIFMFFWIWFFLSSILLKIPLQIQCFPDFVQKVFVWGKY